MSGRRRAASSTPGRLRPALAVAAMVVAYVAFAVIVVGQVVLLHESDGLTTIAIIDTVVWSCSFLGFPAVGALLAVRRPDNPVGWTILAFGAGLYLMLVPGGVAELVFERTGTVGGVVLWLAALLNGVGPLVILAFVHVLLFFPNGQLEGRSRWLSRGAVAATALIVVLRLLRPGALDLAVEGVANPLGIEALREIGGLVGPLTVALVSLGLAALGRLVGRYRRADPVERKQFQWILASLAVFPPMVFIGNAAAGPLGPLASTVVVIAGFNVGFLGFAIALYRAITKQNLYGIDRIVSRTLAYAVVVLVLSGVYLGLVVGLGSVARALTGESGDLIVALSTLAVAALFQPVRGRIRLAIDRRFNRARYDAGRTVDAFGRRLRDEVSLDAIVGGLRATTVTTFRPSNVGVVLVGATPADVARR